MRNRTIQRALGAAALATTSGAGILIAGPASADEHSSVTHALFVQSDQAHNQVLSYVRNADGTLSYVGTFATGGLGAVAQGASADPLASQGSLTLADGGRTLLAVNAASNSVSVFDVHGAYLRLTQTIGSGGQFPASIAVSGDNVVVLNAGGGGAIAGFRLWHHGLAAIAGDVRDLGLANANPPNFLASPGQVGFTPDATKVVVTTKASTSSFEVFGVSHGGTLSQTATVTAAATPVPFSFDFTSSGVLVATEAKSSVVSTYLVNADGTLSALGSVTDGAKALCWIAGADGTFYGSNAGSGTLSAFTVAPSGAPQLAAAVAASTHPGTTDAAVAPDGTLLYVESGGTGALDSFAINPDGTLREVETLWNLPVGAEGIVAS